MKAIVLTINSRCFYYRSLLCLSMQEYMEDIGQREILLDALNWLELGDIKLAL